MKPNGPLQKAHKQKKVLDRVKQKHHFLQILGFFQEVGPREQRQEIELERTLGMRKSFPKVEESNNP
jgi:hypothetical protein